MDKQQRLLSSAHDLFLKQGFKSTNIAEIATAADVAVGTFYNFYDSKTAIFLQVYNSENERVKANIISKLDLNAAPLPLVKKLVQEILEQSKDNLILQEWFTNPKLNRLISKNNKNAVEESLVYTTFIKLVDSWRDRDLIAPDMTKERILSLFNALTVVDFHQSEIATDDYFQLLDDLITGILKVILK